MISKSKLYIDLGFKPLSNLSLVHVTLGAEVEADADGPKIPVL